MNDLVAAMLQLGPGSERDCHRSPPPSASGDALVVDYCAIDAPAIASRAACRRGEQVRDSVPTATAPAPGCRRDRASRHRPNCHRWRCIEAVSTPSRVSHQIPRIGRRIIRTTARDRQSSARGPGRAQRRSPAPRSMLTCCAASCAAIIVSVPPPLRLNIRAHRAPVPHLGARRRNHSCRRGR